MQGPQQWQPEDRFFWAECGRRLAGRQLQLWAASLFCGFAVWTYWSVITVYLLQLGFPYSVEELFSLIAIAGLAGGTLRLSLGFLSPPGGGYRLLFFSALLLVLPALGTGVALQYRDTPLWALQLLALLSGVGGGVFSVFVIAVSDLYPRRERSLALDLSTGLGQSGIVAAQILAPLVVTLAVWGGASGEAITLPSASSTWLGKIDAGERAWPQQVAYLWLALLVLLTVVIAWRGVSNRRMAGRSASAVTAEPAPQRFTVKVLFALALSFASAALGLWLMLPAAANGSGFELSRELVLALVIAATLMSLRLLPATTGSGMDTSFVIFNNKNTWVMSALCAMSLGSFLGFAVALPLTLHLVFGYSHDPVHPAAELSLNPNAPGIFTYVWIGPFIGVLMRSVGAWLAGRFGGARVTEACALLMVVASGFAAYYLNLAYGSPEPERHFLSVLLLFLVIFAAAGAGHAAVLHTVSRLFPPNQTLWINVWIAAIAAYGVFYIPLTFGEHLARHSPEQAMIGFAVFYAVCLFLNRWFYLRKDSALYNP